MTECADVFLCLFVAACLSLTLENRSGIIFATSTSFARLVFIVENAECENDIAEKTAKEEKSPSLKKRYLFCFFVNFFQNFERNQETMLKK